MMYLVDYKSVFRLCLNIRWDKQLLLACLTLLLISCGSTPIKKPLKVQALKTVCPSGMVLRKSIKIQPEKSEPSSQNTIVDKKMPNKQRLSHIKRDCIAKEIIEIAETKEIDADSRDLFNQAITLLAENKFAMAISLLQEVTEKASQFTSPYINLGIAYARMDELAKAEESLKKALQLNNNHPVANNELGVVYRKLGRYGEARSVYESILQQYPDFLPARRNLGVLCDLYLQDLVCAVQQYGFYLKALPDDKQMKIWMADVKNRMSR